MAPPSYWGDDVDVDVELEEDEGLDEDMEALRRACMITGKTPADIQDQSVPDSDDGTSDVDDLDLVRDIQNRFMTPLSVLPPLLALGSCADDSDDDDDFETLRAIQRRFSKYDGEFQNSGKQLHEPELVFPLRLTSGQENPDSDIQSQSNGNGFVVEDIADPKGSCSFSYPAQPENADFGFSGVSFKKSSFPKYGQMFIEAIKKNRLCQKLIRMKLIEIQAKIEENRQLKGRLKCIVDFQDSCNKKAGRIVGFHKDPRINLISLPKSRLLKTGKVRDKKQCPLSRGPEENIHVQSYRMVLTKYPAALNQPPWSQAEKDNLVKGIKQQLQELMFQKSIQQCFESEGSSGDAVVLDDIIKSIGNHEITPESMRSFTPQVDWERLASMYVMSRSGAECEARWLNLENPLINHGAWTNYEDKKLLFSVQERGIYNWIEIATLLDTNRTPCQCLIRYQRSLNAYILKKEWTKDEDAQLCAVVEAVGEDDWQLVASQLEGRTNRQCSNRWLKTLHPSRKRVGRWTVDEDKHLKVAVMLFGPKTWQKIAKFVPGRTQVQCRERWMNVLDPTLNLERWTKEEDSKLIAAIAEHGYCWSKVAALIPPRTDNQCRRRWKVLLPHEVSLAQEARKIQKAALLNNFADREEERPALGPNDFLIASKDVLIEAANENNIEEAKKKQRKQKSVKQKAKSKRQKGKTDKENRNLELIGNEAAEEEAASQIEKKNNRRRRKTSEVHSQEDLCVHTAESQEHSQFPENSELSAAGHGDDFLKTFIRTRLARTDGESAKVKVHPGKTTVRTDGIDVTKKKRGSHELVNTVNETSDPATGKIREEGASAEIWKQLLPHHDDNVEEHSEHLEQSSTVTDSHSDFGAGPKGKIRTTRYRLKGAGKINEKPSVTKGEEVLEKTKRRCIRTKTTISKSKDAGKINEKPSVMKGEEVLEKMKRRCIRTKTETKKDKEVNASELHMNTEIALPDNSVCLDQSVLELDNDVELPGIRCPSLGFAGGLSDPSHICQSMDEFSILSFFEGIEPLHPDHVAPLEPCEVNEGPCGYQQVEAEDVDDTYPTSEVLTGNASSGPYKESDDLKLNRRSRRESRKYIDYKQMSEGKD